MSGGSLVRRFQLNASHTPNAHQHSQSLLLPASVHTSPSPNLPPSRWSCGSASVSLSAGSGFESRRKHHASTRSALRQGDYSPCRVRRLGVDYKLCLSTALVAVSSAVRVRRSVLCSSRVRDKQPAPLAHTHTHTHTHTHDPPDRQSLRWARPSLVGGSRSCTWSG